MSTNAAALQQRMEEEEEMSGAEMHVTGEWEFKILRGCFTGERMRRALEQEQEFGWELHEKLDDWRLRLRRKVEQRLVDARREGDPYRSHASYGNAAAVACIMFGLAAAAVLGIAVAVLANG